MSKPRHMQTVRMCQFPGCNKPCRTGHGGKWCEAHRKLKQSMASNESNQRRRAIEREEMEVGNRDKQSPCKKCHSYALCKLEINRITFWPPCFACSRFYDPELAAVVYRGQVSRREAEVAA